ncbi:MAG: hypothetical protein ACJ8CB_03700, partial [Ktedonobacteraceae bacterium]
GLLLRVERFPIDRVDAPELQPTFIDPPAQVLDHPEVFPLEETAHGGRKNYDSSASMTKNQQLHVSL